MVVVNRSGSIAPLTPPSPPVLANVQHLGYLVTKRKLEEEDAFEDHVNRASVRT
jgi:hypothetical protein